jgi:hypothetical protein
MNLGERIYWTTFGVMLALLAHEFGRGITWAGFVVPTGIMLVGYIMIVAHRLVVRDRPQG